MRGRGQPGSAGLVPAPGCPACGGLFESFAGSASAAADPEAVVRVVATNNVFGALALAVGGDRVEVTSIIGPEPAEPGPFRPSREHAEAVADADLVIGNGGHYDAWVNELLDQTDPRPELVLATDVLGGRSSDTVAAHAHLGYSLPAMGALAERFAKSLTSLDPPNGEAFAANAEMFEEETSSVLDAVAVIRSQHRGARVCVTDPQPQPLVARAGLVNVTPQLLRRSAEPGTEPAPGALARALRTCVGRPPVRAVLVNIRQPTAASTALQAAAEEELIPVVETSDTIPDQTTGYHEWIGLQIDDLAGALADTAPKP